MGRSVIFRLIRANCYARRGSGFRRKSIQAAIGLIRNGGVRKFLLNLLVDAGSLFWVGIAKDAGKFQQHKRPRHENALLVRQSTKGFDRILGLASAGVNNRHLILGHGGEFLVAGAADLLQFFERLIVALEVLETKGGIVARKFSGIRALISVGNFGELLRSILNAGGLIEIERLIGFGGVRTRRDVATRSLPSAVYIAR